MALQQRIISNVRVPDMPRHGNACKLPPWLRLLGVVDAMPVSTASAVEWRSSTSVNVVSW